MSPTPIVGYFETRGQSMAAYSDGTVFALRRDGRISQRKHSGSRYAVIGNVALHRVIAKTFLPNPLNLPEVNHKDGNKRNCAVENLEWVSIRDNKLHAFRTGLITKTNSIKPNAGVRKYRRKWWARVGARYIGSFETREKAVKARQAYLNLLT